MKNVFPSPHPLVAHKLALLRDKNTEPKNFRELVREIAALLTYEATKDLETEKSTIQGWAGPVQVEKIKGKNNSELEKASSKITGTEVKENQDNYGKRE